MSTLACRARVVTAGKPAAPAGARAAGRGAPAPGASGPPRRAHPGCTRPVAAEQSAAPILEEGAGNSARAKQRSAWQSIGPLYAAGFVVAFLLKLFYSRAGADELGWMLGPTARLAGLLGSVHFEWESRTGWISRSGRMILEPACAGVNFLIICFAMLFFTYVARFRRSEGRWAWLVLALCAAYGVTIVTNAARILVAIRLHDMDLSGRWLTPQRVHRAEGTVIYLVALLAVYSLAEWVAARLDESRARPACAFPFAPIGWYALVALGVPLLNRAYDRGGEFFEHAALVVLISALLGLLCLALGRLFGRKSGTGGALSATGARRHHAT